MLTLKVLVKRGCALMLSLAATRATYLGSHDGVGMMFLLNLLG
jgi:hypothetical protein